jgi:serine/threonine-protein kinase haspin
VATSLSSAERETQFEHRDLHWGNILIKPLDQPEDLAAAETEGTLPECLRTATRDVQATVIDFTLSRATLEDGRILSGGLEDDALFDGEGDQQYECYRIMRRLTKGDWQAYCPITNVVVSLHICTERKDR